MRIVQSFWNDDDIYKNKFRIISYFGTSIYIILDVQISSFPLFLQIQDFII